MEEELSFTQVRLDKLVMEAQNSSKWNQWASESFQRGAGRAHKFAKEAKPWKPTSVLMQDGIVTADPLKLLDELGLSWAEIWQAVPKDNVNDEEEEAFIFE
eukprot:2195084-Heterocapsa_arctica.AAC.1